QHARRVRSNIAAIQLPPDNAPLKDTYASLEARAKAGDVDAASRLYHDSKACSTAAQSRDIVARESATLSGDLPDTSKSALAGTNMDLDRIQRLMDFVNQTSSLCDGLPQELLNTGLPNALQAAKLGDQAASDCYVGASNLLAGEGTLDHPEWL